MHRGRLGMIFWSVVSISVGGILLLRGLGYAVTIWDGWPQYWPVLMIGWGVIKLVDYRCLRGSSRPLMPGVEVVLLLLFLFAGTVFTAATRIGSDLSQIGLASEELNLFDILGESFEFSRTVQLEAGPGNTIRIHNIYGSVEVEPGDGNAIVVEVTLRIRASDRVEARRLEPELVFTIERRDGNYVVDSNRDELSSGDRRRFRSSLWVQVPQESEVEVDNKYGTVQVTGLKGDQRVRNRFGPTTVHDVDGDLRIDDAYGDVVAEFVSGDVTVANEFARVAMYRVGGNVSVDARMASVHLSDIDGEVSVVNRVSEVTGESIDGGVRIAGNDHSIDIEEVRSVEVAITYPNIVADPPPQAVDIGNRHGRVRVSFSEPPRGDVAIRGQYTDVSIGLPGDSSFFLDARTREGSIDFDFEGLETFRSGSDVQVVGNMGTQGPDITIETRRGDVRLTRGP